MRYVDDPRCFEMLANAIVKQAADEYRNARRALIRMPNAVPPKEKIQDVEKFFRSEWYQLLTSVDGEYLLRRLEEEAV